MIKFSGLIIWRLGSRSTFRKYSNHGAAMFRNEKEEISKSVGENEKLSDKESAGILGALLPLLNSSEIVLDCKLSPNTVNQSNTQKLNNNITEWAINAVKRGNEKRKNSSKIVKDFKELLHVTDDMGVVKLRGLPYKCSEDEIRQFFDGLSMDPSGVVLSDGPWNTWGVAYAWFPDKGGAEEALQRNKKYILHRYIEVFLSSAEEIRSFCSKMKKVHIRSLHLPRPASGDYGGGLSSHGVFMRGVPYEATKQDVADFFKPIRPVNINILKDIKGRNRGEAYVEFECHEDAVKAMSRDKEYMNKRYIDLFLTSESAENNQKND